VVRNLFEQGVAVKALSRDPERAAQQLPPGVPVIAGDLTSPHSVAAALHGPDSVAGEIHLIRGARTAGIRQLVKVSVIGPASDHFVLLARGHATIEKELAESGVPATLLRPNWFMENFLGAANTIMHQGAIYGSAGEGRVAFIDSRDTADAAVACIWPA
jgi:uncharacterized protein YbjT (DUF2867 family)